VSYTLRKEAIAEKRASWKNATENGFKVGTYEELIPTADVVGNLTPDKQHTPVIANVMPLMKKGASLWYSHGFNIVEEGMQIRKDITVVMMAPKGPGTEVRVEYTRGFGIPTLIAVHPENDPEGKGWAIAKALAVGTGGSRAGVLESITANPGDTVNVGALIGAIGASGAAAGAAPAASKPAEVPQPAAVAAEPALKGGNGSAGAAVPPAPSAAKLMAENNVNEADVSGSGKRGQVLKEDVLAAIAKPGAAPATAKAANSRQPALTALKSAVRSAQLVGV
jgi:hypothetical protein